MGFDIDAYRISHSELEIVTIELEYEISFWLNVFNVAFDSPEDKD